MPTRNGNAPRGSATSDDVAERSPHRSRSFNIANLPNDIREQINLRLSDGESGSELAAWLNALPSVQSILGSQFNGSPISEVNLTLWRQGGYLQWLTERECFDSARALAEGDCDLATTGFSAERLLNVLTLRIGQLLMRWECSPDDGVSELARFSEVARKARILQGISRSLLAIHRIQSQSALKKSEPATSSASSHARPEPDTKPSLPGEAPFRRPRGPEHAGGAGGGEERGEPIRNPKSAMPKNLSGPISPSNLSHTPFTPDIDLEEILRAVS